MYKAYHHFEDLKHAVEEDKLAKGVGAATLDRYPIRFVLFDNFRDCYEFVEYLQGDCGAHVESVRSVVGWCGWRSISESG